MAESVGKVFRCDGAGCPQLKVTATNYRKKAPPGWRYRMGPDGKALIACSDECSGKVDASVAPAWTPV